MRSRMLQGGLSLKPAARAHTFTPPLTMTSKPPPTVAHPRRSHFAGLKTLLTRLGSKTVLELCPPGLLDSLVQHVAASNRTAPAAGRLLLRCVRAPLPHTTGRAVHGHTAPMH